jgi:hypothetical protein
MSGYNKPDHNRWERFQRVRRDHVEKQELKANHKYLASKAQVKNGGTDMLTAFKEKHWDSIFWKWKGMVRALKFAYNNPRHVQIAVSLEDDEFTIESNYSGLSNIGHLKVLKEVGKEVEMMQMTEVELKNMMN